MNTEKEKALINFKKVRSLMDKMIEMGENNQYCIDIMQQNLAAIGLLKSANQILMENHLNSCFATAISSKQSKKKEQMVEEILTVTKLINK
ncbi:MAG: metal-sensing transcriptional repressor [Candidatus Dojkabacteria bacterium]|jgi:DNA-binding FrmR family transcriptional regulator|nr:metal-sensing transcriptional repressor [Candidatus Dojkabacteria bacterium]